MKLNDTSFTGAAGWVVYRDDMVDDDRRLVALKENRSGVRLQVVTLNNDVSAGDSCQALVTSQSQDYKNAVASLTVPVGVPAKLADAVTCGFHGTSPTTKKGTQVTFTVAKRHKDDVTLILRSTIPDGQPPASPAKAQLAAMSCQASQSFGVPLPLC